MGGESKGKHRAGRREDDGESSHLLLGSLGTDVLDGETCTDTPTRSASISSRYTTYSLARLTRGQALPQLLGLLTILEDQGVQVSGTPDLELGDLLALGSGGLGLFGEDGVGADGGGVEEGLLDLGRWEREVGVGGSVSVWWHV